MNTNFETARKAMINSQLRTSGVNTPFVLERMSDVAREEFVPKAVKEAAYIDRSLALENGRRIAQPVFYGKMLEAAQPVPEDKALVVDAGSGYLPALLRPLVGALDVLSVEEALALTPAKKGKYTLLLIDGAAEHVPDGLAAALAEGGRIITGLVENNITRLAHGVKAGAKDAPQLTALAELGIPRIAEFDQAKDWSF